MSQHHCALQTNEILYEILLTVDLTTLITSCNRVSRAWRAICSAARIQRRLFFAPAPAPSIQQRRSSSEPRYVVNPLLDKAFPGWLRFDGDYPKAYNNFTSLPWNQAPDIWRRQDATWRHMQITQPATTTLQIDMVEENTAALQLAVVACPQGLLMGDLYDYAVNLALRSLMFVPHFNRLGEPSSKYVVLQLEVFELGISHPCSRLEFLNKYLSLGNASTIAPEMHNLAVDDNDFELFEQRLFEWEVEAYGDGNDDDEEDSVR